MNPRFSPFVSSDRVEIPVTEIVKLPVVAFALASVTVTSKLLLPAVVAIPEIAPVDDSDNPAGSNPELRLQLYGVVPPVAESDAW